MGSGLKQPTRPKDEAWKRNFGFLIHDVARLRKALFDERMKAFGLTRSQWWVIGHLNRRDGVTQSELGRELDMSKVTLGGILDRLEEKGWLERRADTEDRRAKRIYLTRRLAGIRRGMDAAAVEINERCFSNVTEQDRRRIISILKAMKDNLRAMSEVSGDLGPE
jgi:MarR family transcriptional regulator for hemolysin